jgi:fluoride exporter
MRTRYGAVIVGALVGTALRVGITELVPVTGDGFPWPTLVINVVGSFVLGALVGHAWGSAPDWLKAAIGPGLLGTFTTFSAVALALASLPIATAVGYAAASLLLGLGASYAGLRVGGGRRRRSLDADGAEL